MAWLGHNELKINQCFQTIDILTWFILVIYFHIFMNYEHVDIIPLAGVVVIDKPMIDDRLATADFISIPLITTRAGDDNDFIVFVIRNVSVRIAGIRCYCCEKTNPPLTHLPRNKMATILQTVSNAFSWMKWMRIFLLRFKLHWSLFQWNN